MKEEMVCQESAGSDEISLVDLFVVLWDRKWLIFVSFVFFVSVGLGYALLAPEVYEYSTVIEVGTTLKNVENGSPVVIEEPASLLEKLKTSYVPITVHTVSEAGDLAIANPKITATSPKNSRLVVFKSKGFLKQEDAYRALHQNVVDVVVNDHKEVIASALRELSAKVKDSQIVLSELSNPALLKVAKTELASAIQGEKRALDDLKSLQKVEILALEARVAGEKAKLDDLAGQSQQIDVQLELTEKERLLLERQVEEVHIALKEVKAGRKGAVDGVADATNALTLMMVENQIEQQRTRLERLETRLTIDLKRQLGELAVKKAENSRMQGVQARFLKEAESALSKRKLDSVGEIAAAHESIAAAENDLVKFEIDRETKISLQEQVIEQLKSREDVLQNTKPLAVAMLSAERLSPKRALIVALSGIMGVMFGVVLVFLVSFLGQVKRRQLQITSERG
jgi:capsular polysaccharide biosynthesis protein